MGDKDSIRRRREIVAVVALLSACLMIASCAAVGRKVGSRPERDIHGPITLTAEWTEIRPPDPLKPEGEINVVDLTFAKEYRPDYRANAPRLPDGTLATPEVQLVDAQGNTYALGVESMDGKGMGFASFDPNSHLENLLKDRVYTAVRIRCNRPLECEKITWRSYNQRDRK